MPRKMLTFDVIEAKPPTHYVRIPEGSEYRGVGVSPADPTYFRVWFEGDPAYHANPVQLFILADGVETPSDGKHLGSFLHTDMTSRHVFMAPHRPVCKCECGKGGDCLHEWNGPWVSGGITCTSCGININDHKFPPRMRSSSYPRLRNKSSFQKDDCIVCEGPSTKEVVLGTAYIRCCGNPDCIDKAIEIAKAAEGAMHT